MLSATQVKAVVFELDGILVDTANDICHAAEEMLSDLRLPSLRSEHVRDWIGDGSDKLVHRILSRKIDGIVPDPVFRIGSALFMKAYQRRNHEGASLFEGVEACLHQLRRRKIPMAVVTNQATAQANEILTVLGIRSHFSLVLGRDALQEPKPSADGLLEAALLLQLKPEQLLLVGGSVNDVNASRAAHCSVVCVSHGYNYGIDIRKSAPDIVVDSLAELPVYLNQNKRRTTKPRSVRKVTSKAGKEKR
ncbi:phosphoglycolate phosphatase [Enterovibrio norvegicus FF-33]|uniref:HAD hydrolase-like protein n=1 Tax=Enterovibrio norvegicus TaxID=188144 RepID=UPI000317F2E1|nr:HAD hydrolase-like protein [Enterovibrio norvegicus]OEE66348.1 phosphoglycolate phosphatase [Enterovibrio norvegicus FF-33]